MVEPGIIEDDRDLLLPGFALKSVQRETLEETFGAFASHITGRTFDHDFEHLPPRDTENDLVS